MTYQLLPRQSALASLLLDPPAAVSYGDVWGEDGIGMRYRFMVYDIDAITYGVDAVYVFARYEAGVYVPLYIGRANILSERLSSHERRFEAKRRGAEFLLVHIPGSGDPVPYAEAERRLIRRFAPALNEQFNPLASLLAR
jgi:hypothetical protein